MFGKLRDKLKGALSVFSKKAEEEVKELEEKPKKEVVKKPKVEKKEVKKKELKKEEKEVPKKKVEKKPVKVEVEEVKEKKKGEPVKEVKEKKPLKVEKIETKKEEKKETPKEEKVVETSNTESKEEETPKVEVYDQEPEKKSFFKKIFSRKEEVIEEEPQEVIEEKKEEPEEKKAVPEEPVETKEEHVEEIKVTKEEPIEEVKEPETKKPVEEKESFFGKVKKSFTTKTISEEKFEELFWELEITLLENNVSVEVIEKIKEDLKLELVNKPLPRDVLKKIEDTLRQTLTEILSHEKVNIIKKINDKEGPFIVAFFGINGTGKTTSIAKLTHLLQKNKLSVVLAACDTFRAAAIQQLQEHANNLKVKMIKHDYGSDAAAVAFDAIKFAEKNKIDVVLIDTAGRLHSNTNLMAELEKIIRITKPDMKIFVGESITGNDCIEQARKFNELVEMDGAILTKVDVDEKGGAPLSISYTIKKPILFLGVGQGYEDLEEFDPAVILERLGF